MTTLTTSTRAAAVNKEGARAALPDAALDQLFRCARSQNGWLPDPVADEVLRHLYELTRWGPTSMNCCPARFVFVRTSAGKEALRPSLTPANVDKVMTAPVVAIVAHDLRFFEHLPHLFPHRDVSAQFVADATHAERTAFRNGTLQGAYLMLAARSLGLECGPLSGFDNGLVDRAFFAGTSWRSNFLCGLGHGNPEKLFARLPRLDFDQACQLR